MSRAMLHDPAALPAMDAPPYCRPATEAEIFRLMLTDDASIRDRLAMEKGGGWIVGFFSFLTKDGRQTLWGWYRGDFGIIQRPISLEPLATVHTLIHIPLGYSLASFTDWRDAEAGAETLAQALDWRGATITRLEAQAQHGLTALLQRFDRRAFFGFGDIYKLKPAASAPKAN